MIMEQCSVMLSVQVRNDKDSKMWNWIGVISIEQSLIGIIDYVTIDTLTVKFCQSVIHIL